MGKDEGFPQPSTFNLQPFLKPVADVFEDRVAAQVIPEHVVGVRVFQKRFLLGSELMEPGFDLIRTDEDITACGENEAWALDLGSAGWHDFHEAADGVQNAK
jgi:hypothetical protein